MNRQKTLMLVIQDKAMRGMRDSMTSSEEGRMAILTMTLKKCSIMDPDRDNKCKRRAQTSNSTWKLNLWKLFRALRKLSLSIVTTSAPLVKALSVDQGHTLPLVRHVGDKAIKPLSKVLSLCNRCVEVAMDSGATSDLRVSRAQEEVSFTVQSKRQLMYQKALTQVLTYEWQRKATRGRVDQPVT